VIGPGSKLGRYRLVEPIGAGGMASVYRAYDPTLDRHVAIKILAPDLARDETYRLRFQQEARSLAKVDHPNLVSIYAVGRESGVSFYAMELVNGLPLSKILSARGHMPPDEALSVFCQFLQGLAAAHDAGIYHRDVKPGNIMIGKAGRVLLMDFGLARRAEGQTLTVAGSVLGTPEYMSPEQACGGRADERSDLYAAGVVLYEMLAGAPPFRGPDTISILRQHVESPVPPISDFVVDLPAPIEAILGRLLEKKPEARYPLVAALVADLAAVAPDERTQQRTCREMMSALSDLVSRATRQSAAVANASEFETFGDASASSANEAASQAALSRNRRKRARLRIVAVVVAAMIVLLLIGHALLRRGGEQPPGGDSPTPVVPEISWRVRLRNGETFSGRADRTRLGSGPDGRTYLVFDGRDEPVPVSDIQEMTKGGDD